MEKNYWIYLLIMFGVTYLIRVIPMVLVGKTENRFLRSFLAYVPYAALGSMTFPAVFFSTGSMAASIIGTATALIAAAKNGSLVVVALISSAVVFAVSLVI